jgi:hypothetical protein
MNWRIGLATLLLLWVASANARHGSGFLEPRRATPGIKLELVELPPSRPSGTKKYFLRVEGAPRGVTFGVWTKDFGQQFAETFGGFQMDESGALVSTSDAGERNRLEDIVLGPGPYPSGAVWMVALASDDHQITAFAKVIPHPIVVKDGTCKLSLELISLHGNRFVAFGEGFEASEDVQIELRAGDRVTRKTQRASADGELPLDVVSHGGIDADQRASYKLKGRSCSAEARYEWGEAALKRY